MADALIESLADAAGADAVVSSVPAEYLTDATGRGLRGTARALVRSGVGAAERSYALIDRLLR